MATMIIDTCINCSACVSECPNGAISQGAELCHRPHALHGVRGLSRAGVVRGGVSRQLLHPGV